MWSETSGNLDITNRTNFLTPRNTLNLVVRPNVLLPGTTYTFAFYATNINGTGTATSRILDFYFYNLNDQQRNCSQYGSLRRLLYGFTRFRFCPPNNLHNHLLKLAGRRTKYRVIVSLNCIHWEIWTHIDIHLRTYWELQKLTSLLPKLALSLVLLSLCLPKQHKSPSLLGYHPIKLYKALNILDKFQIENVFHAIATVSLSTVVLPPQNKSDSLRLASEALNNAIQNLNVYLSNSSTHRLNLSKKDMEMMAQVYKI